MPRCLFAVGLDSLWVNVPSLHIACCPAKCNHGILSPGVGNWASGRMQGLIEKTSYSVGVFRVVGISQVRVYKVICTIFRNSHCGIAVP